MEQDQASGRSGRFAPPQAEVADIGADGIELGGRGTRLGAMIVDAVILGGVLWLVSKVTPWNVFAPDVSGGMFRMLLVNLLVGFVVFCALNAYLLATQGQTIGKRLLGLRIVRPDGERASLVRLLGARYGVGYLLNLIPLVGGLYGLIDALLIFRSSCRCLHDNIADTIVVKT